MLMPGLLFLLVALFRLTLELLTVLEGAADAGADADNTDDNGAHAAADDDAAPAAALGPGHPHNVAQPAPL